MTCLFVCLFVLNSIFMFCNKQTIAEMWRAYTGPNISLKACDGRRVWAKFAGHDMVIPVLLCYGNHKFSDVLYLHQIHDHSDFAN